jgi:hypothetical protein
MIGSNPIKRKIPGRIESFFRFTKTFRLVNALLRDARVPIYRKLAFSLALAALIVAMVFPELMADGLVSAVAPIISALVGIPIEAGIDWVAFVLLLPFLLRIFPANLMQEHYDQIFRGQKKALKETSDSLKTLSNKEHSAA